MSRNPLFPALPLSEGDGNCLATDDMEPDEVLRRPSSVTASTSLRQPISKAAVDDNIKQKEASYRQEPKPIMTFPLF